MADPIRSDHRIIQEILKKSGKGGVHHNVKVYDQIGHAFEKMGGNWESLCKGCPTNTKLMKRVINFAVKNWFTVPGFPMRNKKAEE